MTMTAEVTSGADLVPDASSVGARLWSSIAVVAVYLGAALVLFRVPWRSPSSTLIGGGGDAGLFIWFQRWTAHAVANGRNPFVTDYLNYPDGVNAMWNTATPLLGVLSAPVAALFGPIVAYNAVMTACLVLSATTAFLLIRRWVTHLPAAAAAGLLYGFSPFMVAHSLGHTHMTAAFLLPLLVLCMDEIVVRQSGSPVRWGAALGGLSAAQLLVGEELLALAAVAFIVGFCILAAQHPRQVRSRLPFVGRAVLVSVLVFAVLAAWPLANQFFGAQRWNGVVQPRNVFVTDLANLVVPTWVTQLSPAAANGITGRFTGNLVESTGYLGVPLLVLMAVTAVRRWSRPLVRATAVVAVVLVVLSLGPRLHIRGAIMSVPLPWAVVDELPLLANMLPGRLMGLAFLAAAVLLAVAIDDLVPARRWRRWAPAVLATASIVSLVPTADFLSGGYGVPKFFASDAVRVLPRGEPALVLPMVIHTGAGEAMVWQVFADFRFKMVGGYFIGPNEDGGPRFGPPPSATVETMTAVQGGQTVALTEELRTLIRGELRAWGVRSVVVAPMTHRDLVLDVVTWLTGTPPRRVADADVWTGLTWEAPSAAPPARRSPAPLPPAR